MSSRNFFIGIACVVVGLVLYLFIGQSVPFGNITFFVPNLFILVGLLFIVIEIMVRREIEQIGKIVPDSVKNALSETTRTTVDEATNVLSKTTKDLLHRVELSELAKECEQIGLTEIDPDCTSYDFGKIILEAQKLIIVLNDGRTWASVHRDRLRRRFADPTKETTFFLCHPDSPMIQVLSRKGSTDDDAIKSRILQTVTLLEEIKQPSTSLEILGHHLFNPYSLIVGDDSAIMIPYFLSRGGRTVPLFKYHETDDRGYFRYIVEDLERLRMDAQDISNMSRGIKTTDGVVRFRTR